MAVGVGISLMGGRHGVGEFSLLLLEDLAFGKVVGVVIDDRVQRREGFARV